MDETAALPRTHSLPRQSRRAVLGGLVALVAVAGLIGSRTTTGASTRATAGAAGVAGLAPPTTVVVPGQPIPLGVPQATATAARGSGPAAAGGESSGAVAIGAGPTLSAASGSVAPTATGAVGLSDTAKIVKTGSIEVGVGKGTLQRTLDSVTTTTAGLGGYVSSAKTTGSSTGEDHASGTLVVRVPATQFEQLLSQVRRLGDVRSVTTAGQDVTAQFADVDARIKALTATRDQLLTIMGSATAVQDVLSVQDRLGGVQAELDSLIGQQKVLADQADLATLTVNVLEPGADLAITPVDDTWTFGDAFRDARHRFADGLKDVIAGSGTVALIVLALAVAYGVFVLARRQRRPAATVDA